MSGRDSKHWNESELVEDVVGPRRNKSLSEASDLISSSNSERQKKEEPSHVPDFGRPGAELASSDHKNVTGINSGVASNDPDSPVGIRVTSIDPDNPVGISLTVDETVSHLSDLMTECVDVHFMGIWGMVGSGKTWFARSLYNKMSSEFPHHHFYENVGEIGLLRVLLRLCTRSMGIHNTEEGINELNNRFHNERVLLVLDGVNDISQLRNLPGTPQWFGAGSIIIITTGDMSLLRSHGVPIYKTEAMNDNESLQLLSRNAFNTDHPEDNYFSLSQSVVQYAGGHPLALQVLGSSLHQRTIPQWRKALVDWKLNSHGIILERLKMHYEELGEENKGIFLHIANFLVGGEKDKIIQELKSFDFDDQTIEHGLRVLIAKHVIIEEENCLKMHVLFQQLGKSIDPQEGKNLLLRRYMHYVSKDQFQNGWYIGGVMSSLVGVVTYATSSSFNLLWGEWKWWTIVLYCLFIFIVCGVMLIAPKLSQLQVLRRPWVKLVLPYMIMMLSILYSYYHDNHVTKPDGLSLTSTIAFASMSVCLSKQIELEFDLGVSFFLLGFMVQKLMKIEFKLFFAGAVIFAIFMVIRSNSWICQYLSLFSNVADVLFRKGHRQQNLCAEWLFRKNGSFGK